jgi:hypothetical protein
MLKYVHLLAINEPSFTPPPSIEPSADKEFKHTRKKSTREKSEVDGGGDGVVRREKSELG